MRPINNKDKYNVNIDEREKKTELSGVPEVS